MAGVLTPSLGFALRASLRLSKFAPGEFVGVPGAGAGRKPCASAGRGIHPVRTVYCADRLVETSGTGFKPRPAEGLVGNAGYG
jgi:hypothetical protein